MFLILLGALITIAVEGLVFMLSREYRTRAFLMTSALINLMTNLLLNLCFWLTGRNLPLLSFPVLSAEFIVWEIEFILYGLCFRFTSKLLLFVLMANLLTFSLSFFFD